MANINIYVLFRQEEKIYVHREREIESARARARQTDRQTHTQREILSLTHTYHADARAGIQIYTHIYSDCH